MKKGAVLRAKEETRLDGGGHVLVIKTHCPWYIESMEGNTIHLVRTAAELTLPKKVVEKIFEEVRM